MGIFGRNNYEEKVGKDNVDQFIGTRFDEKTRGSVAKAQAMISKAENIRKEFIVACEEFGALSKEPDTDYSVVTSINYLKGSKNSYSRAMISVAGISINSIKGKTEYEKCATSLSNLEDMIKEVLTTNASFKHVLKGYSNHLGSFKRSFSDLEDLSNKIKNELGKRSKEFDEYKSIAAVIERLGSLESEKKVLMERSNMLESGLDDPIVLDKETLEEIEERKKKIQGLDKEITELQFNIESNIKQIERASRKYDYLPGKKLSLIKVVTDPISIMLDNAFDYRLFAEEIRSLEKELEEGRITVKNGDSLSAPIKRILNGDIKAVMDELSEKLKEKSTLSRGLDELEREVLKVSKVIKDRKEREDDINRMRIRIEEILKEEEETKREIEELSLRYYGRRIMIID